VDALDAFHGFGLVGVFSRDLDIVVLDLVVFSWGGRAGVDGKKFVVGGFDADSGGEIVLT